MTGWLSRAICAGGSIDLSSDASCMGAHVLSDSIWLYHASALVPIALGLDIMRLDQCWEHAHAWVHGAAVAGQGSIQHKCGGDIYVYLLGSHVCMNEDVATATTAWWWKELNLSSAQVYG